MRGKKWNVLLCFFVLFFSRSLYAQSTISTDAEILLDARQVFIDTDGTTWATTKRTLRVNTNEAAQKYATVKFSFDPETDTVFIKPPQISTKEEVSFSPRALPDLIKEFSHYVQKNVKDISVALPLTKKGDMATYEILLKRKPLLHDAFSAVQLFGDELPIKESVFSITFPEKFSIYYQLSNTTLTPQIETKNGMKTYTFTAQNLPSLQKNSDGFIAESSIPRLVVSSVNSWDILGNELTTIFTDKLNDKDSLQKALKEIKVISQEKEELLSKLFYFAALNVHPVSSDLPRGNVIPRALSEILSTHQGDCKDKALLLVALLSSFNIQSYPVLLHTFLDIDLSKELPTPYLFNHALVYVPKQDGFKNDLFLDPTLLSQSWNTLNPSVAGKKGLVLAGEKSEFIVIQNP